MLRALIAQGGFGEADELAVPLGYTKVASAAILRQLEELVPLRQRDRAQPRFHRRGLAVECYHRFRISFSERPDGDAVIHES
ncbi:hypothetical protein MTX20_07410 [Bradyrhizobium sp. ISRA435]|nr:hypothetical protein MTX20_07410 [Bradyrhizobium sp. ISRA435]